MLSDAERKQFGLLGMLASIGGMLVLARSRFLVARNPKEYDEAQHMLDTVIEHATEVAREIDVEDVEPAADKLAELAKSVLAQAAAEARVTVDTAAIAAEHGMVLTPQLLALLDDVVKRVLGLSEEEEE
jgi:hypothetical protein